MGVSEPNWLITNTDCQKTCARFKEIKENQPKRAITMAGSCSENALAAVFLSSMALYVSCVGTRTTPQGNEIGFSETNALKITPSAATNANIS